MKKPPITPSVVGMPTSPCTSMPSPIAGGIKGMYMSGVPDIDNGNLTRLVKLVNL